VEVWAEGEEGGVKASGKRRHLIVVPFRHTPDFFTMTAYERRDTEDLLR
jgi:hypothetical protein